MNQSQPSSNSREEFEENIFFKGGLKYLVNGVKQGYEQYQKLQSELRFEKKRNFKLIKRSLRKKKQIRRVRARLNYLKKNISSRLESSTDMIQNAIKNLSSKIEKDLEASTKEIKDSVSSTRISNDDTINHVLTRVEECLENTQSIREESNRISVKLNDVASEFTQNILSVPRRVSNALRLGQKLSNHHQQEISPLFEALEIRLLESKKEAAQYAQSLVKSFISGFQAMISKMKETLFETISLKDQSSLLSQRVKESCEEVIQKVNQDSQIISTQVDEVILGIKDLNATLFDNPLFKNLRERVDLLFEANLNSSKVLDREAIEISVNLVDELEEQGMIGGDSTHFAVKNNDSYMIATECKALKLIENKILVYSSHLLIDDATLTDIVYVPYLDCYLMDYHHQIYRKDIDEMPPYLYLDVLCGYREGASFRYSSLHQRLLINKDCKTISVINPDTKEFEIELESCFGDNICDFRLVGEQEDRVLTITKLGTITLCSLRYSEKKGLVIAGYVLELIEEGRKERPQSMTTCSKTDHVLLEIGGYNGFALICSRMIICEINEDRLTKKACIDQYNQDIGVKFALESCRFSGKHITWVGLSILDKGLIQVFDYDSETGEFRELKSKRMVHQERYPIRLQRLGTKFYYSGEYGKVMSLSVNF